MFNPLEVPPFFDVLVLPPSEYQESLSHAQRVTNGKLLLVKDELIAEGRDDFGEPVKIMRSSIAEYPKGEKPNLDDAFFQPLQLNFRGEMELINVGPSDAVFNQAIDIHIDGQMISQTYSCGRDSLIRFEGFHIDHPEKNLPVPFPEDLIPIGFLQNGDVLVFQGTRQQVIRFNENSGQWCNVSPEGQEVIDGNIEDRYGYQFLCPTTEELEVFLVSPNNPKHTEISNYSNLTGLSETGVLIGLDKQNNPRYWHENGSTGRLALSDSIDDSFCFPSVIRTNQTPYGSIELIVGTCGKLHQSTRYQPNPLEDVSCTFTPNHVALWVASSEDFAQGVSPVGVDINELCIDSDERIVVATGMTNQLDILATTSSGDSALLVRRSW